MAIHISRNKELDRSERNKLLRRLAQGRMIPVVNYMRDQQQRKKTENTVSVRPMRLINIMEFSSYLSFDEIKSRVENQPSWKMTYYKAEHEGKVSVYVDGKIQDGKRKRGSLHGVLWKCLLRFTIEIGGPPRHFYRATMEYPEEIQNMFEAKDIRWKELTKPYDEKLRNLILILDSVIADID